MSKIINISDKLSKSKPVIQIGEKQYEVDDSMANVMKFEELTTMSSTEGMMKAIELSIGKKAVEEIGLMTYSISNFKILTIAILAVMQGLEYEEAEARFPK